MTVIVFFNSSTTINVRPVLFVFGFTVDIFLTKTKQLTEGGRSRPGVQDEKARRNSGGATVFCALGRSHSYETPQVGLKLPL